MTKFTRWAIPRAMGIGLFPVLLAVEASAASTLPEGSINPGGRAWVVGISSLRLSLTGVPLRLSRRQ
jgi:hypothetical protein